MENIYKDRGISLEKLNEIKSTRTKDWTWYRKNFLSGEVERAGGEQYKLFLRLNVSPEFMLMLQNEFNRARSTYDAKYGVFDEILKQNEGNVIDIFDDASKAIEERKMNYLILNPRILQDKDCKFEFVGLFSDEEVSLWVEKYIRPAVMEIVDAQFEAICELVEEAEAATTV